jgi:two-component system, OmpR family, sensor histidine kinase ArlS
MPVRIRITLIFTILVVLIAGIMCSSIYYFSYRARTNTIKTRLTNRAITTARLLAQREIFSEELVQRIDSVTTISLKNKTVQAYDYRNRKIYNYSDIPGDTLIIDINILDEARINGVYFFAISDKEAIAYHHTDSNTRIVVISAAEDTDGKQSLNMLFKILVISFLLGTAVVLVAGYFFSTRLLRPVKKITEDVEEISVQNLARRIKTGSTKDEWYKLSSTLNQLLNRLQESFELQRRFIANASHELSTPLTSIASQLEVSLQRERDAAEYRRVMQSVHHDVQHMNKLTQTLLEFAKAAGDPGGLEIKPIRIDEILMELPSQIAKINQRYTVSLQFENMPEDDRHILVFGNEALLLTAIKNIVINACKYSSNQKATISLEVQGEYLSVSISDQGTGIPENELQHIFQPFYRATDNKGSDGVGLGLSLSERIVKLHKGTIRVTSVVGTGTSFIIHLPVAATSFEM